MQTAVFCRDLKRPAKIVFVKHIGSPRKGMPATKAGANVIVLSEWRPRQQQVLRFGRRKKRGT